jgi:hypothetical protein
VQPFVTLSTTVQEAVGETGRAVEAELRLSSTERALANRFRESWDARDLAAAAFLRYSLVLKEVTDAGGHGDEAVTRVSSAVEDLAQSVNLSLPGQVLSLATDAGKLVFAQIAAARARSELKDALGDLQPAVNRVVEIFAQDFVDADDVLLAVSELRRVEIDSAFQRRLGFRNDLLERQEALYEVGTLNEDQRRDLAEITVLLQGTEAWFRDYQAQVDGVNQRLTEGRRLIAATALAVGSWADAHEEVVVAVSMEEERLRPPDVLAAANEAERLIAEFKASVR